MITLQFKSIKRRYTIAILVDGIIRHQYFFIVSENESSHTEAVYRSIGLRSMFGVGKPRMNNSLPMYPVPGSQVFYRTYIQDCKYINW